MGLKGSFNDPGLAFRRRLARSVIQKVSKRKMTTTTRAPTVMPAMAPGAKPPESSDGKVLFVPEFRDGAGGSVVFEGVPVVVAPSAGFVALGKALALSASVQGIDFVYGEININSQTSFSC